MGRRETVYNYGVIKDVLYIISQCIKVKCIGHVKAYIAELCIVHGYYVKRQVVTVFYVVLQQAVTFYSVPLKSDNGS